LGFTPKEKLNHLHLYDQSQETFSDELSQQLPILDPELYVQVAENLEVRAIPVV